MDKSDIKEIFQAIERVEKLKKNYFEYCEAKLKSLIDRGVRDEQSIDAMYEKLLPFCTDEPFAELFNEIEDYVRSFDETFALTYRLWQDKMKKEEQEE